MQRETVREELNELMCDSRLGACGRRFEINTRPIQVFTDDDQPWSAPIDRNNSGCPDQPRSCVFRVEKVEGCTATLRALIDAGPAANAVPGCPRHNFLATDSFITVKLSCICAIRCLGDTFVDLCIRNIP